MRDVVQKPARPIVLPEIGLSIGVALLGLIVPPAPVVYRRAFHTAAVMALLWIGALVIFFTLWAGIGFLGHMGLWFFGALGLALPGRLAWIERQLARGAGDAAQLVPVIAKWINSAEAGKR